jgi:serine acetyltransferase
MVSELKRIGKQNEFHGRLVLSILYFEKTSIVKFPFKFLRRMIIEMFYNTQINPKIFVNKEAIISCRLPHPFQIIVHGSASIGQRSTIFHGVTIGSAERPGEMHAAHVGNDVYLGCKSTMLGEISIADGVRIGAHALVLRSVLENGKTIVGIYK